MELLIKDIQSPEDIRLLKELAKRLGLKTAKLSLRDKEDIGLSMAIEKGRKSGYTPEEKITGILHHIQRKK